MQHHSTPKGVTRELNEATRALLELETRSGSYEYWSTPTPGDCPLQRKLDEVTTARAEGKLNEHLSGIETIASLRPGALTAVGALRDRVQHARRVLRQLVRRLNAQALVTDWRRARSATKAKVRMPRRATTRTGRPRERRSVATRRAAGIRSGADPGPADPHAGHPRRRSAVTA
jgi:hypothetical protein